MFDDEQRTDKELIEQALLMWANYIESGSVLTSESDVLQRNSMVPERDQVRLPHLNDEQRQLVARLKKLAVDQRTRR